MCSICPTAAARSLRGEQAIQAFVVSRHALHAGRQHRDERYGQMDLPRRRMSRRASNSQVQMLGASPRTAWKVLQHNTMGTSWVYLLAAPNTMSSARRHAATDLICQVLPTVRRGGGDVERAAGFVRCGAGFGSFVALPQRAPSGFGDSAGG
jgi:hypothetical protein